jgi:hypothetical protein
MTGWLPDGALEWQGRPVARAVAGAAPRQRAVLTGTVRRVVVRHARSASATVGVPGRGTSLDAVLDDGTGTIVVRWVGRDSVPGVHVGARMSVQGTVVHLHGRNVPLNPLYRFEPGAGTRQGSLAAEVVHDGSPPSPAARDDGDPRRPRKEPPAALAQDGSSVS